MVFAKGRADAERAPEIYRETPINRGWSFQLLRWLFYGGGQGAPRVRKNSNVTCGTVGGRRFGVATGNARFSLFLVASEIAITSRDDRSVADSRRIREPRGR